MDVIKNQNDLMLNVIHSPDIIDRRANIANIILSTGVAHIITGPRRCGKSVFACQEIKALLMASRELLCNNLQIITRDYSNEEIFEGKKIKLMPNWRWLLQ